MNSFVHRAMLDADAPIRRMADVANPDHARRGRWSALLLLSDAPAETGRTACHGGRPGRHQPAAM